MTPQARFQRALWGMLKRAPWRRAFGSRVNESAGPARRCPAAGSKARLPPERTRSSPAPRSTDRESTKWWSAHNRRGSRAPPTQGLRARSSQSFISPSHGRVTADPACAPGRVQKPYSACQLPFALLRPGSHSRVLLRRRNGQWICCNCKFVVSAEQCFRALRPARILFLGRVIWRGQKARRAPGARPGRRLPVASIVAALRRL